MVKPISKSMEWIFPSNSKSYDIEKAYAKHGFVFWRHWASLQVGDVVFVYRTAPHKKIQYKTLVTHTHLEYSPNFEDRDCWNPEMSARNNTYRFARHEFIGEIDDDRLSLKNLLEHGLNGHPQNPMRVINAELSTYLNDCFQSPHQVIHDNYYPDEIHDPAHGKYWEGAKKQITVNAYERNAEAREKCIEHHGRACVVCGFSFGERYGPGFAQIIHVHHKKPLAEIDKAYSIDPETDLAPVCPNCHTVIHSKKDGTFSIEEVRAMLSK